MEELKIQQTFLDLIKSGKKTFVARREDYLVGPAKLVVCDNENGDYLNVNLEFIREIKRKELYTLFFDLHYFDFWDIDILVSHLDFFTDEYRSNYYHSEYYFLYKIEKIKGDK